MGSTSSQIAKTLMGRQLVFGGWSFGGSHQAGIEGTCLCALGLAWEAPAKVAMAIRFLLDSQCADAGWPAFTGDPEP
jgi:hypothetical protein